MQKHKNILDIDKVFSKICTVALLLFLLSSLTSCDNCSIEANTGGASTVERIYFTSYPFNSVVPSVYSVSNTGRDVRLLSANATLFSAPSFDGRIALLRYDPERKRNVLMIARTDRTDSLSIDEDNSDYSVAMPILSADGRKIVFNGGNNRLYIWVQHNDGSSYIEKITSDLYENTFPSFSPDGKKIAFFEGSIRSGSMRLKVLDAERPDVILFDKQIVDNSPILMPNSNVCWINSNATIGFLLKYQNYERYYLINLDGSEKIYNFGELGALYCALSPNGKYLVFTSYSGQLWGLNLIGDAKYSIITSDDEFSTILFQEWNDDSNKLIYCKFYQDEGFGLFSTLYLVEIRERDDMLEVSKQSIINNNVYKGFWSRNKK